MATKIPRQTRASRSLALHLFAGHSDRAVGAFFMAKGLFEKTPATSKAPDKTPESLTEAEPPLKRPVELGGPKGPEPTRYGDWEKAGRCSDF